jgi:TFIIF-interacting CTD phosphatase-like protein
MNVLDPENTIISKRLYRHHCIPRGQYMIKDISVLKGIDMKDVILVDNSIVSMAF